MVDKAIATAKGIQELEIQLHKQGIRIVFRENVQRNVYGITFIDNATRAVFNGSDLGKAYCAKAFLERLPPGATKEKEQPEILLLGMAAQSVPADQKTHPAHDQPVIERLIDTLLSTKHGEYAPDPFRKKKEKRLQVE